MDNHQRICRVYREERLQVQGRKGEARQTRAIVPERTRPRDARPQSLILSLSCGPYYYVVDVYGYHKGGCPTWEEPPRRRVVAGVYRAALAPVGFLMGVTGYISGIYGAQVAAYWLGMVGG